MANNPKPPYKGVIIEVKSPLGDFTTTQIDLQDPVNAEQVSDMLTGLEFKSQMRFPLSDDTVLLMPAEVLLNSIFKLRYIK